MQERGLSVGHSIVWRWVQRYAPEINKRIRPHLKMSGTSYRIDETYIKVGTSCKYLYRAGDRCDVPAGVPHSAVMGPLGCRYIVGERAAAH